MIKLYILQLFVLFVISYNITFDDVFSLYTGLDCTGIYLKCIKNDNNKWVCIFPDITSSQVIWGCNHASGQQYYNYYNVDTYAVYVLNGNSIQIFITSYNGTYIKPCIINNNGCSICGVANLCFTGS